MKQLPLIFLALFGILIPFQQKAYCADLLSTNLPTIFGAALATSTLNGGAMPEITFWMGPQKYATTSNIPNTGSTEFTLGIEITTKSIDLGDKVTLDWNLGWERMSASGTDSFGSPVTQAVWSIPVNGLYIGPRFDRNFDPFSLYVYIYGSFDDLSDLVTNDQITIGNNSYTLTGGGPGFEPGFGISLKIAKELAIGADYSHQFLKISNIVVGTTSSFPAAYTPVHSLDFSGDSLNLSISFSPAPSDAKKTKDQKVEDARIKLANAKIDFTQKRLKEAIDNCDSVIVSWYLAAGIKVQKTDYLNACEAVTNLFPEPKITPTTKAKGD